MSSMPLMKAAPIG
ncbi:hypothetical protein EYZ11_010962 [Aspergillus tanneri]|uniref:Uncharacterized protein n=1 Tax=Aspergillus tanneri TaxID=1220188 RepID=A0A4S3J674_9EURO|nr:hypothetical protein EYZ11_010962 [Aspergillus tanneri]